MRKLVRQRPQIFIVAGLKMNYTLYILFPGPHPLAIEKAGSPLPVKDSAEGKGKKSK